MKYNNLTFNKLDKYYIYLSVLISK